MSHVPPRDVTAEKRATERARKIFGDDDEEEATAHIEYRRELGGVVATARSPLRYGSRAELSVRGQNSGEASRRMVELLDWYEDMCQRADQPPPMEPLPPTAHQAREAVEHAWTEVTNLPPETPHYEGICYLLKSATELLDAVIGDTPARQPSNRAPPLKESGRSGVRKK